MRKIVSIGESMVELSQADGDLWRLGFAGDTLNTAWYLRALLGADWQVSYATRLGLDRFSQAMRGFITGAGISPDAIQNDDSRTVGLYAINLDGGERSFTYWRSDSAARGLADDPAVLAQAVAGRDLIFLSGITLAILPETGRRTLLDAIGKERGHGCKVAFDPNIRPRLWSSAETLRSTITAAACQADIILPSFDDEAQWFGDQNPAATLSRYRALGAGEVVVKNGAGQLLLWQAVEGETSLTLPMVTPSDTTGAGDSFNGGYLAARLLGQGCEAAARCGHRLASRVVQYPGALLPRDAMAEFARNDGPGASATAIQAAAT